MRKAMFCARPGHVGRQLLRIVFERPRPPAIRQINAVRVDWLKPPLKSERQAAGCQLAG